MGDDTFRAAGTLGLADQPAVIDESLVEGIDLFRFYGGFEQVVGLVGGYLGADEGQTLGNPVDVGVDGHGRHTEGEAEDDAGGLGADAGELAQPGFGFGQGHFPQEGEVQGAVEFDDFGQDFLDAGGLDLGQAARR